MIAALLGKPMILICKQFDPDLRCMLTSASCPSKANASNSSVNRMERLGLCTFGTDYNITLFNKINIPKDKMYTVQMSKTILIVEVYCELTQMCQELKAAQGFHDQL